jgi:hypothetical protein
MPRWNDFKLLLPKGRPYHIDRDRAKRLILAGLATRVFGKRQTLELLPATLSVGRTLVPKDCREFIDELLDELDQRRHRRRGSHLLRVHHSTVNKEYVKYKRLLEEDRLLHKEREERSKKDKDFLAQNRT